jgi:ribose transport system permease protein
METTAKSDAPPAESADTAEPGAPIVPSRRRSIGALLSPKNIGAIYVWIAIIVLFSLVASDTFPTSQTAKSILNEYSVTGLMALSLVVPLAASYFDLSIGYTMSLSGILAAELLNKTSMSPVEVGIVVIAACVVVGLFNAFIVIGLGVDSFIGTLGSGAIIAAITIGICGGLTVTGRIGGSFTKLASTSVGGITLPVFYMLGVMLLLAWVLERTKTGRYLYAIGFERETARLTGIRVNRLGILAFVTSAVIAGFAGLLLSARVSSADPNAGVSYLIPAFSAAFLGATQFRRGRFNPWGAVVAVLLLGTGDVGLLLAGGPIWTPQLFEGAVLIAAVALTGFGQNAIRERIAVLRARGQQESAVQPRPPSVDSSPPGPQPQ